MLNQSQSLIGTLDQWRKYLSSEKDHLLFNLTEEEIERFTKELRFCKDGGICSLNYSDIEEKLSYSKYAQLLNLFGLDIERLSTPQPGHLIKDFRYVDEETIHREEGYIVAPKGGVDATINNSDEWNKFLASKPGQTLGNKTGKSVLDRFTKELVFETDGIRSIYYKELSQILSVVEYDELLERLAGRFCVQHREGCGGGGGCPFKDYKCIGGGTCINGIQGKGYICTCNC